MEAECTALSTVAFVPLSRGIIALADANDLPALSQFRWHAAKGTNSIYAGACGGHRSKAAIGRRHFKMHALLLDFPQIVDHVSGFTLDNRRANIRACTSQQNACNARKSIGKTSRYKGVSWHRRSQRWQVYVSRHHRPVYVTSSKCETAAARAYDAAARDLYGPYARLNFQEPR